MFTDVGGRYTAIRDMKPNECSFSTSLYAHQLELNIPSRSIADDWRRYTMEMACSNTGVSVKECNQPVRSSQPLNGPPELNPWVVT